MALVRVSIMVRFGNALFSWQLFHSELVKTARLVAYPRPSPLCIPTRLILPRVTFENIANEGRHFLLNVRYIRLLGHIGIVCPTD